MTTVTIASIEVKDPRSVVITTEKKRLGFWTEKAHQFDFKVGATYEVELEYKSLDDGRKLTNIVKAKQVPGGLPTTPTTSPPPANGGGGSYRPTCPQDAERMFVCATLGALIRAGEVKNDKQQLWAATQMLRGLWKHTWGFDSVQQHLEAAE